MVRLIMSGSGEGKTKQLLELMNAAADTETGCMVCRQLRHFPRFRGQSVQGGPRHGRAECRRVPQLDGKVLCALEPEDHRHGQRGPGFRH